MNWTQPTPLPFAGNVALWPLAVVCRPTSLLRLVVGAFGVTLALITLVWLGWIVRWVLEQRW